MKIKVGDKVRVISGKYKGHDGQIMKVFAKQKKVIVEKINLIKKHVKPSQSNPKGQIKTMEAPLHISNVALVKKTNVKEFKPVKQKAKPKVKNKGLKLQAKGQKDE